MKHPYRKVTVSEWKTDHSESHPHAVCNEDKTEYILSLNDGTGDMTRTQAQEYIKNNWNKEV